MNNKIRLYLYGILLVTLLIFVSRVADDFLLIIVTHFNLHDVLYLRTYVFLVSIALQVIGIAFLVRIRSQPLNMSTLLHIFIAAVIGGVGSVWLIMVFISYEL